MSKPSIEIIETRLFPGVVADELVAAIGDAIADHGSCSLVLSGGQTPASTYRELSRPPRVSEIDWGNVKMFWGDERFVESDSTHSNYNMVDDTLLHNISDPKPEVFKINTKLKTPEATATAYEQTIRSALEISETEVPEFDIVLLGIGDDGHIASLFPKSKLISDNKSLCCAVSKDCGEYPRITLMPAALFSARKIYFLVRGEDKAEIISRVIAGNESESELPAMLYRRVPEKVTWFVDSAAGKKIEQSLS
ncbi:MAG: 6-phosphogluconolactonase [Bdellovibrionota bacterium]